MTIHYIEQAGKGGKKEGREERRKGWGQHLLLNGCMVLGAVVLSETVEFGLQFHLELRELLLQLLSVHPLSQFERLTVRGFMHFFLFTLVSQRPRMGVVRWGGWGGVGETL